MIIAVIPARGGSKRIPRKNIRSFAGKPIMSYSIAAARECRLFERIVVSTDDAEVAGVARDCGAETPFMRPAELADDHAGTVAVVAHALAWFAGHGHKVELVCCIYATAPFLRPDDLRRGYQALLDAGKAFAFSATSYPFSVQRALRVVSGGGVEPFFPQWIESRSQDLEPAYHDAGQFYWGRAEAFGAGLAMFAHHSVAVVLPRARVQDIDTSEDWERAELMYAAAAGIEADRRRE
jgi:pseudaminic acid cytidylyltransferase